VKPHLRKLASYWHNLVDAPNNTDYYATPHTHAHPFIGPVSRIIRVSRYQKGKTNLDFTEARGSEWQWHQLGHMQVCTSLQTDNHASTSPLSSFTDRMPFLPPNQQRQSTKGKQLCHTTSVKSQLSQSCWLLMLLLLVV